MKKIGIYYGTTSGKTEGVIDELEFHLGDIECELHNVVDGISSITEYDNLILVTPTYGVGELQEDWEKEVDNLKKLSLKGKKVGLIGLGSQTTFGESFVGGLRKLYDIICEVDGEIVGQTDTSGYSYEETEAIVDGKFVGLVLDEDNQEDLTPDRIIGWVEAVKKAFI